MSETKTRINWQDLLKAKWAKDIYVNNPSMSADYLASAAKILAGNEDYSARGALIVAAFWGLENFGVNDTDAITLVARGLESLGVEVVDLPVSQSR